MGSRHLSRRTSSNHVTIRVKSLQELLPPSLEVCPCQKPQDTAYDVSFEDSAQQLRANSQACRQCSPLGGDMAALSAEWKAQMTIDVAKVKRGHRQPMAWQNLFTTRWRWVAGSRCDGILGRIAASADKVLWRSGTHVDRCFLLQW